MSKKQRIPREPVDMTVTGLSHDGRGIARPQQKTIFVFGALPEEQVTAQIVRTHRRFDEANTQTVHKPSPDRVSPACTHFGVCGGCQMQHLASPKQVAYKQAWVAEQLTHIAKVTPRHWLPPLTGPVWGYRQKARLSVRWIEKKQTIAVGFREQKNSKVALIESCAILDPRLGEKIAPLRAMIESLQGAQHIAQIEVAAAEVGVALVFRHLEALTDADIAMVKAFCDQHGFLGYLQPGGVDTVHPIDPDQSDLYLHYDLPHQQLTFEYHPLDFTQVNRHMNQEMVDQALRLLNPQANERVLDLFCGLGNFSLPMAQKAQEVLGVEGAYTAVAQAERNAIHNHLDNVKFVAYDLTQSLVSAPWAQQTFDKIVLDPPRSGAQTVVEQLNRFQAKQILYISCNPATFCRDAAILVHQQGYALAELGVMDMFPHTAHIELMGLFKKIP